MQVDFNTSYYEEEHGKTPHWNEVGDYTFLPPRNLGRRPWLIVGLPFRDAKEEALRQIGDRPVAEGAEFVLVP